VLLPEVDVLHIIRRLDEDHPHNQSIPENKVPSPLNTLLSDYGDEWLAKTRASFRIYSLIQAD
jgi:hypothetical protein